MPEAFLLHRVDEPESELVVLETDPEHIAEYFEAVLDQSDRWGLGTLVMKGNGAIYTIRPIAVMGTRGRPLGADEELFVWD